MLVTGIETNMWNRDTYVFVDIYNPIVLAFKLGEREFLSHGAVIGDSSVLHQLMFLVILA